jgi:hypothetical protein
MSDYYKHRLPFLAIGHPLGDYPQFVQTADVALVITEQGEQSVNRQVSSQDLKTRFHPSDLEKPGKRYFHTPFDGNPRSMLRVTPVISNPGLDHRRLDIS